MGFLGDAIKGGFGAVIDGVKNIADEFHLSGEEKQLFVAEMETILQKRDSEVEQTIRQELQARSQIIVAEMAQGDNYTKRARPTVVYFGLLVIFINHCAAPILAQAFGWTLPALALPVEFWTAWGGVVGIWSIGRSAEKRGKRNRATELITGSKDLFGNF